MFEPTLFFSNIIAGQWPMIWGEDNDSQGKRAKMENRFKFDESLTSQQKMDSLHIQLKQLKASTSAGLVLIIVAVAAVCFLKISSLYFIAGISIFFLAKVVNPILELTSKSVLLARTDPSFVATYGCKALLEHAQALIYNVPQQLQKWALERGEEGAKKLDEDDMTAYTYFEQEAKIAQNVLGRDPHLNLVKPWYILFKSRNIEERAQARRDINSIYQGIAQRDLSSTFNNDLSHDYQFKHKLLKA